MENNTQSIMDALLWMADAADEDCPAHYRTNDFNEALKNAREVIAAALAVGVSPGSL
jgi:hypothetical protein